MYLLQKQPTEYPEALLSSSCICIQHSGSTHGWLDENIFF